MNRADSKWWSAGFTQEWWDSMTPAEREVVLDTLSDAEVEDLFTDWRVWGRDSQLPPDGDWRTWLLCCGRGFGKMIDVDTPIPTPAGWRRLGDLAVGDAVFDEAGRPCLIEKVFDGLPEIAYRLHFSDGTSIDACSEHQWVTWTHAERKAYLRSAHTEPSRFPVEWPQWRSPSLVGAKRLGREVVEAALDLARGGVSARKAAKSLGVCRQALAPHIAAGAYLPKAPTVRDDALGPQIRTTQQIVDSFTHSARGDLNHCVPVAGALQAPPADLPLDPYLLGAYLGDGSANDGGLTCHQDDQPHFYAAFEAHGFQPHARKDPQQIAFYGFRVALRAAGVLERKRAPDAYLWGSIEQRLGLLQGLMDTDGYVCPGSGHVEFCNTDKGLVDAVVHLARSLGQKPVVAESRSTLYGRDCGPRWRVTWRPTLQVFRLPRKAASVRLDGGAQALRNHHRMIVRWERIAPKPMRCLTVDSPNSMFLAGEGMIPTHNTRTAVEYIIEEVQKGYVKRIAIVGQGLDDIRSVMVEGDSGFLACSKPGNRPKFQPSVGGGRLVWPNKAVAAIYSAEDTEALRGPQFHLAWFDEPMAVPADKRERALSNLRFGLRLPVPGSRPRLILSTTPKKHSWMRQMLIDCGNPKKKIHLTKGSTYENEANLAEDYLEMVVEDYEGTRLGRQEIHGELLGDDENAIWADGTLERQRKHNPAREDGVWTREDLIAFAKTCDKVVVGVDPNIKAGATDGKSKQATKAAHAAGIIVAASKGRERFILADRSTRGGPSRWASAAVQAALDFDADEIVAEVNQGGDMVRMVIQQAADAVDVKVKVVKVHATRGKQRRAEPVASAYERGRVFHLGARGSPKAPGPFLALEDQMMNLHEAYDPTGEDFDRCDALVWGLTRLKLGKASSRVGATGSAGVQSFSHYG